MASTPEFVRYVCEQIAGAGAVRYRKMFGEYLIYVDERPAVLVIENTAYVKCLPVLEELALETGHPFPDGPAYYVLDIDKAEQCRDAAARVAAVPGGLREGDALFGLMFYHREDRSLCLHPYSAVTRSQIIRLQY